MDNAKIARFFEETAEILEILGENPFRVRSYLNAARAVRDLNRNAAAAAKAGEDLTAIPGIGESIAAKIGEIAATGRLKYLEELKEKIPPQLPSLLRISGLGPKKVKLFHEKLGIDSIDSLEKAAREGRLDGLEGVGEKTVANLLKAIGNRRKGEGRFRLDAGRAAAETVIAHLKKTPGVDRLVAAGSIRRWSETVGDVDILAVGKPGGPVMEKFTGHPEVEQVLAKGQTKASVRLDGGLQIDLRLLPADQYGAALLYFTGSKDHNVALRKLAQEKGLKLSEYGVFRGKKSRAGREEKECYRSLGLEWIPPELRENRGEIEAAANGKLPRLVELENIRGDLQMHTTATDGANTIAEMAEAAAGLGYEYIAITEHSRAVRVAGGLDETALTKHFKEIDKVNRRTRKITVLKGVEVDILADGGLDLKDRFLAECDLVVASVHSRFNLPEGEMTRRLVKALRHPRVHILGHPTGRLILDREPYGFDLDEVFKVAREEGVILEINAHPSRLDLNDIHARMAGEKGVKLCVNTDAHSTAGLEMMTYGIHIARRAWLTGKSIVNTLELKALLKTLR